VWISKHFKQGRRGLLLSGFVLPSEGMYGQLGVLRKCTLEHLDSLRAITVDQGKRDYKLLRGRATGMWKKKRDRIRQRSPAQDAFPFEDICRREPDKPYKLMDVSGCPHQKQDELAPNQTAKIL
jgi:hypothetical protein